MRKFKQIIDLPESEVTITIAYCKKCNKAQYAGVTHRIGKDGKEELAKYAVDGHKIDTVPLVVYQEVVKEDWWCDCYIKENKQK